jgi:hypothetical protein
MLGRSSRFFDAGYDVPKYKLLIGGEPLFVKVVKSFEEYFSSDLFVFVVRKDFNDAKWVTEHAQGLCIKEYKVIELDYETRGQAETVDVALQLLDRSNEEIYIFNIDTILTQFKKFSTEADGYLETFNAEGDHWSYARTDDSGKVLETAEKVRISDNCSNGLYYFRSADVYQRYYKSYQIHCVGETYIAPMYNLLIADKLLVLNKSVDHDTVILCGTPLEYERLIC